MTEENKIKRNENLHKLDPKARTVHAELKWVLEMTERIYYLGVGVEARTVLVVDMAVPTFSLSFSSYTKRKDFYNAKTQRKNMCSLF